MLVYSKFDAKKVDCQRFLPGDLQGASLRPRFDILKVASEPLSDLSKKSPAGKWIQQTSLEDSPVKKQDHFSRRGNRTRSNKDNPATGSLVLRTLDDAFACKNVWERRAVQAYARSTSPQTIYPELQDQLVGIDAKVLQSIPRLKSPERSMLKPFQNRSHKHCVEEDQRGLSAMEKHNILPELKRLDELQRQRELQVSMRPALLGVSTTPHSPVELTPDFVQTTGTFKRAESPLPRYTLQGQPLEAFKLEKPQFSDSGFSISEGFANESHPDGFDEEALNKNQDQNLNSHTFTLHLDVDGLEETFEGSRHTYRTGFFHNTGQTDFQMKNTKGRIYRSSGSAKITSKTRSSMMSSITQPSVDFYRDTRISTISEPSLWLNQDVNRVSVSSHGRLQGVKHSDMVRWPKYEESNNTFVDTSLGPKKVVRVLEHYGGGSPNSLMVPAPTQSLFENSMLHKTGTTSALHQLPSHQLSFEERTSILLESLR